MIMRALGATVLGLAVASAGGSAASADVTGGQGETAVVLAPDVYDLLVGAGVEIATTGPADAEAFMGTIKATFPITAIKGEDTIKHKGGLRLSLGDVSLSVKNFTIELDSATVSGVASGSEVGQAGRIDLFKIKRTDDPELGAVRLVLTKGAAEAANATFGTDLGKGDLFGYATPMPED